MTQACRPNAWPRHGARPGDTTRANLLILGIKKYIYSCSPRLMVYDSTTATPSLNIIFWWTQCDSVTCLQASAMHSEAPRGNRHSRLASSSRTMLEMSLQPTALSSRLMAVSMRAWWLISGSGAAESVLVAERTGRCFCIAIAIAGAPELGSRIRLNSWLWRRPISYRRMSLQNYVHKQFRITSSGCCLCLTCSCGQTCN